VRRTLLARMIRAALLTWLIALAGCNTAPTIVAQKYEPPRVDCTLQRTPDVPAWPTLWWVDGPAWAIETLGILEQERALRGREHACIAQLKAQGIVR